jgi:hypothetical protein
MLKTVRLQVDILQHQLEALKKLQRLGGLRSIRELWDTAFTLLKWAAKKKSQGFAIGSLSADGNFTELEMPFLEHYATSSKKEDESGEGLGVGAQRKPAERVETPATTAVNGNLRLTKKRHTA